MVPSPSTPTLTGGKQQTGFNDLLDQAVEQAVNDDAAESPAAALNPALNPAALNPAASQLPANLLQSAVPAPSLQVTGTPDQPASGKTPARPLPVASRQTSAARAFYKPSKLPEPASVVASLAPSTPLPQPPVTGRLDSQPAPTLPDPTLEPSAPNNPSPAITAPSAGEQPSASGQVLAQPAETPATAPHSAKSAPEALSASSKLFSVDRAPDGPVAVPTLLQDTAPVPVLAPSAPVEAAPAPLANSPAHVDAPPAVSAPAPQTNRTAPRMRPDARPSMASLRSEPREIPSEPTSPEAPIPPAAIDSAPALPSEIPTAIAQSADASVPTVTRIDARRAPLAEAEPTAKPSRPQTDRPPETHAESSATPERAFADQLARVLASANLTPVEPAPPSADAAPPTTTGALAFSTRLVPSHSPQTPSATAPRPAAEAPPTTAARPTDTQPDAGRDIDAASSVTAKPAVHRAPAADEAASSAAAPSSPALDVAARTVPATDSSDARHAADAAPAATAPARPTASVDVPAEPPKVASAVHDIRLQINGGDQRVDVRIVERGGDVHVAVRTPDANLAGTLREDLPSLSARLEETGFHAETWHTGLPAQERQAVVETASAAAPQNQDNHPGHDRGQQQDGRQQPRNQQDQPRKEDRKDFAWLFTSLR